MKNAYQLSLFAESDGGGSSPKSAPVGRAGLVVPSIKHRMKSALAAAVPPLSREQLVDRMNAIARRENLKITIGKGKLTSAVLDKWLAANEPDLPPLLGLEVFMLALGDLGPLKVLAEIHGCTLLTPQEALFYEFGKAKFEAREHARSLKRLEDTITESRKTRR